jgi:hypothetical protein
VDGKPWFATDRAPANRRRGSCMIDLIAQVDTPPERGETVIGRLLAAP